MSTSDETFMSWLLKAQAMEEQGEQVLFDLAHSMDRYPEIKSQIEHHIEVTRKQADRLRGCIATSRLREAQEIEEEGEQVLSDLARRIDEFPELKSQVEQHLEVVRQRAGRLRSGIERREGAQSAVKCTMANILGALQGISAIFEGDEVIKSVLATYTLKHMEIYSYKILITAAEKLGDVETRRVLEDILREEEDMAKWLESRLYPTIHEYLGREEIPHTAAKH